MPALPSRLRLAIVFLLLLAAAPAAHAAMTITLQSSMPSDRLYTSYDTGTTGGYQWRNDTTNGRRDLGQSFYAGTAFTLDTVGFQLYGNIQSGDAGAAVTLSVYQSASASSLGSLLASQGGTFPTATGGAGDWLSFDLDDISLAAGSYYTVLLSFDDAAASRNLVLDVVNPGTYDNGSVWQSDGTTPAREGSDLYFYVQAAATVPEPASLGLALAGGASALLATLGRLRPRREIRG